MIVLGTIQNLRNQVIRRYKTVICQSWRFIKVELCNPVNSSQTAIEFRLSTTLYICIDVTLCNKVFKIKVVIYLVQEIFQHVHPPFFAFNKAIMGF